MIAVHSIQIRPLGLNDVDAFIAFLAEIQAHGDTTFFHPHPFSKSEAQRICSYTGQDIYCALWVGSHIAVYGMLRGWDSGYDVPALGIIVSAQYRGQGMGKLFMLFLHSVARLRGAQRVRLKVYPENKPALRLYQQLGYKFTAQEAGQLIGYVELC